MDCDHHEDPVQIVGVLEAETPTRITLEVSFDTSTPTETVLDRVRHAVDAHARPAAVQAVRRAKAAWN